MENITLFDIIDEQNSSQKTNTRIDVAKMEFLGAETLYWQDLFFGYERLHAITFSSGIGFAYQLIRMFEEAEIIFGCENVISYSLQEVMAYQHKLIEAMNEIAGKMKIDLIERIKNNTLHFYVARQKLSHEKIYLLEADDGRKRVIMGSANMSHRAFNGLQRENICYIDGENAFQWYYSIYQELKESCSDMIGEKALLVSDLSNNIDELPISKTVQINKTLIIEPNVQLNDDVRFALDVKNLSNNIKPMMPKADKKGKILLSPDNIKIMRHHLVQEQEREKEKRSVYPQLEIFPYENIARLNGTDLDLAPSKEEITNDVNLFLYYMNGYEKFHGDVTEVQKRYFEFANWFFCSPFMPTMRDLAVRYNQNQLPYPVFGLIYGQSKAGKTSFLETLLKMMIGQKTKISAPDFTRSSIEGLKRTVKGAPIIVDDLTNARFNQHAIETIKNDDFGIADHLVNYPAVVISANEDVKAVSQEIIRRTVICHVQIGLTNTEVMKSNIVRTVQKNIGTAFYREYLHRMFEVVPQLAEELKDDESVCTPDILSLSSKIIYNIFAQFSSTPLPAYIKELSLENYFNEKVTGQQAIQSIKNAWRINRKAFEISKSRNELCYNTGGIYEADRLIKELPETLEPRKSREWVIMNLEEAKKFFNIDFKKSFFH